MLNGELNKPEGRLNIDIALVTDGKRIAIEYDSWFWHAHKIEKDQRRAKALIYCGWKMLRVKSNYLIPPAEQLESAAEKLVRGQDYIEIVLDDWGKGPTRFEIESL